MVPRVQLPPEIQLAQRLAGNEQVTRDRAVRKLRKYIVARTQRAAGWRLRGEVWARSASPPGRAGPGGRRLRAARGWGQFRLGGLRTAWSLLVAARACGRRFPLTPAAIVTV